MFMNCPVSSGRNSAYFTFNNLPLVFIYNVNNDLGGALRERRERAREIVTSTQRDGRTCDKGVAALTPVTTCPSAALPNTCEGQPPPPLQVAGLFGPCRLLFLWGLNDQELGRTLPVLLSACSGLGVGSRGPRWALGRPVHKVGLFLPLLPTLRLPCELLLWYVHGGKGARLGEGHRVLP